MSKPLFPHQHNGAMRIAERPSRLIWRSTWASAKPGLLSKPCCCAGPGACS